MNRVRCLLLFVLVCSTSPLASGPVLAQASLDAMLRPYLASHGLPALAAAVVKNGEIVAAGAVGTRRMGADAPVTLNDRFHIGSDTKAMTALLAAMLVEEGALRWNSTPAAVFPEFAPGMDPGFAKVTLEQLLSHSGGLPTDNEVIGEVWKQAMLQGGNLDTMRRFVVEAWSTMPLASSPGARFEYSNMGYVIAGAMIERAAGRTWDELMVERIFSPLGLSTAGLGCQASLGKVDAPLGHIMIDGKAQALLAGPNCDNPSIIGPAGIAHLSILDFARWASWNAGEGKRGPALVSPKTARKLHTPVIGFTPREDAKPGTPKIKGGYGFGWGVVKIDSVSHPLLQHGGSNTYNLAQVLVDTKKNLAVVMAANIGGEKADEAMGILMRELYAKYAVAAKN
ncbi:MAG: beta-lactamase family protein [Desulfovibrio sp.]|nr:beta-lactamase family protein [Desulfovibrio sp.]MBI4961081.1 beta-lactamase family protein [Desulfovibrio sp.]